MRRLIVGSLVVVALVGMRRAAGETIDQSNFPATWGGGWTHVQTPNSKMYQTFRPNLPIITAVDIDIHNGNPGNGDDTITVNIVQLDTVLASRSQLVTDGFEGILHFDLLNQLEVVPQDTYELWVHDGGRVTFGWKYGGNQYADGMRYVFDEPRVGSDWYFQTYGVPEPSTLALLATGAVGVLAWACRRRKTR